MPPSRFIDLHALQHFPPSCLNRGEYGEPKAMHMGNTTRSVISSQTQKYNWRAEIEEELDEVTARTRNVPPLLTNALHQAGWPADLADFAGTQIARSASPGGLKTDPRNRHRTQAMLLFPADGLIDELINLCNKHRPGLEDALALQQQEKKPKKPPPDPLPTTEIAALITRRTATINLFGRMLAGVEGGHVEGCVQSAFAFTVHTCHQQPDFFSAQETWPLPGDQGSAHIDTAFLTTGVYYRFASLNLSELIHNLDEDRTQAARLLTLFIHAFTMTYPQAKKNSTAPATLPDLVHYVVRDRRPVSYASAFEQPVTSAPAGGYLAPARDALTAYADTCERLIGTRHRIAHGHTTSHPQPHPQLGTSHPSFEELAKACTQAATGTTS